MLENALIKKEIQKGIIPDPSIPVDPNTGMPMDQQQMDLGQPVMEPEVDASSVNADAKVAEVDAGPMKMPKGGTI
jgi:hypothetical protein